MRVEDALGLQTECDARRFKLRENKGHDYASDEDCLMNFKKVARVCELVMVDTTTPEGVALFFVIHKVLRIGNLLHRGGTPANESVDDSIIDLMNYAELLREIMLERCVNERGMVDVTKP